MNSIFFLRYIYKVAQLQDTVSGLFELFNMVVRYYILFVFWQHFGIISTFITAIMVEYKIRQYKEGGS